MLFDKFVRYFPTVFLAALLVLLTIGCAKFNKASITRPHLVEDLEGNVVLIAAGESHTCATTADSKLYCWGSNDRGELGNPEFRLGRSQPFPRAVPAIDRVKAVAAGRNYNCIIRASDENTLCWGANDVGQTGKGTAVIETPKVQPKNTGPTQNPNPNPMNTQPQVNGTSGQENTSSYGDSSASYETISGFDQPAVRAPQRFLLQEGGRTVSPAAIVTGPDRACAYKGSDVWCWGRVLQAHGFQQPEVPIPGAFAGPVYLSRHRVGEDFRFSGGITAIAPFGTNTCAIVSGALRCLGREPAVQVKDVQLMAASSNQLCLTKERDIEKGLWCWNGRTPGLQKIGDGKDITRLVGGADHLCALYRNQKVKCWGNNLYGQVGNGASGNVVPAPADVVGLPGRIEQISAGGNHSCAVTSTGDAYCWGDNRKGQLGKEPPPESE